MTVGMFGEECKGGTVGISIEDLQVATAWMFGVDCKVATEGCICKDCKEATTLAYLSGAMGT